VLNVFNVSRSYYVRGPATVQMFFKSDGSISYSGYKVAYRMEANRSFNYGGGYISYRSDDSGDED